MNYSEEEKKAIERIHDLIHTCDVGIAKHGEYDDLFLLDKQALETVLNLIETQKAEIEKKNRIINLMAEQLTTPINGKEWIIEYYTKLVEEGKQNG